MYYFASDIHLGAGGPAAARAVEKRFVAWLDEVSRDADAVFILGDLFDFWFEYKRVVPKGFVRVLGKLCELTDRGIRVVFMTGNHDMWVRDYFEAECGVEVYTSPRIMELAGKRVFLAHGDNMKIDHLPVLRFMNAVFRSKTIRFLFSWLVHPDWAMRFGQWWSGKSCKSHLVSEMGDHITDPLIGICPRICRSRTPRLFHLRPYAPAARLFRRKFAGAVPWGVALRSGLCGHRLRGQRLVEKILIRPCNSISICSVRSERTAL